MSLDERDRIKSSRSQWLNRIQTIPSRSISWKSKNLKSLTNEKLTLIN